LAQQRGLPAGDVGDALLQRRSLLLPFGGGVVVDGGQVGSEAAARSGPNTRSA
jgi:hypothetical protein